MANPHFNSTRWTDGLEIPTEEVSPISPDDQLTWIGNIHPFSDTDALSEIVSGPGDACGEFPLSNGTAAFGALGFQPNWHVNPTSGWTGHASSELPFVASSPAFEDANSAFSPTLSGSLILPPGSPLPTRHWSLSDGSAGSPAFSFDSPGISPGESFSTYSPPSAHLSTGADLPIGLQDGLEEILRHAGYESKVPMLRDLIAELKTDQQLGHNIESDTPDRVVSGKMFAHFLEKRPVRGQAAAKTWIFTCLFCPYKIQNRTQMIQHIMAHHFEYRPYQCHTCESRFCRPADRKKHQEDKHSGTSFRCECGKKYTALRNFKRHQSGSECS